VTRLRRVRQTASGFSRRRRGRGFEYLDHRGNPIREPHVLARIRSLAIPPAWTDVWICADERGHLQAVGTDAAGRRQYLYHPDWRRQRDRAKFVRIESFAEALPRLRRRVARDLARRGYPRERVLACAVRMLDLGLFRIGGDDGNGSFGLSTLRRSHVAIDRDGVTFDFRGKGGKRQIRRVDDDAVRSIVRGLIRREDRSRDLLAWKDGTGWHAVGAGDVNGYLKDTAGEDFSAKDFRTWHATVIAAESLSERGASRSRRAADRAIRGAVQDVADQLGNTPAVARHSYIDPRILDRYLDGEVIDVRAGSTPSPGVEAAVLDLLRRRGESAHATAA
jgi:DNA topoisomerase IB